MRVSKFLLPLIILAIVLVPMIAQAHFEGSYSVDFIHGFTHLLTGLDHMAAMVAVGLWVLDVGRIYFWVGLGKRETTCF